MPGATTEQIAWAAGLFEGEGSVFNAKCRDTPRMQIMMTDLDVLEHFHAIVGFGTVRGPYRSKNWQAHYKDAWIWQSQALKDVFLLLKNFYPYLGERRRAQAASAIAAYYLSPIKRKKS